MKKITLTFLLLFLFLSAFIYLGGEYSKRDIEYGEKNDINILSFKKNNNNKTGSNIIDFRSININFKKIKTTAMNNMGSRYLNVEEIKKHNTANNCYLAINNNVYDVSGYLDYHPAGRGTIVSNCGKEVTGLFAMIHSNRAWDLLRKYKIGIIGKRQINSTESVLKYISKELKKNNPKIKIINIRPKKTFYIAKIVDKGQLYELHINSVGTIVSQEKQNNEVDWSFWDTDKDDIE